LIMKLSNWQHVSCPSSCHDRMDTKTKETTCPDLCVQVDVTN
jgi:hypothetical protein